MDPKVKSQKFGFAVYPSVKLMGTKKSKNGKMKFSFLKELIFGDFISVFFENGKVVEKEVGSKTYIKVRSRRQNGYILADEIQPNRILEVNFVDVGQGDGCHLVTPEDEHFIIDAGVSDNMFRFISWRFNLRNSKVKPPKFTAVITHSDQDHYRGFTKLFTHQTGFSNEINFEAIYHNGLVEESGSSVDKLGTIITEKGKQYITDLCRTNAQYNSRASSVDSKGRYINMLNKTTAPKKSLKFGDKPLYNKKGTKIEVLGPVTQKVGNKDALPVFDSSKGRTKNGHSVILKLTIGNLRMLLGGDLNSSSEEYLFRHFAKKDVAKLREKIEDKNTTKAEKEKAIKQVQAAVKKLRDHFEVDICKSCHHGSADFTNEFLDVLNPIATVISSGDEESYCHPRPETLGTIGKYSRGNRSLVFSTELARSSKEFIDLSGLSSFKKKERIVTVYGMINVRTDGEKVIIAQKLEQAATGRNWDINKLVWDDTIKEYRYVP